MSDIEEPVAKIAKFEMSHTYTQVEELDEGQEEWLSEDILTDEDYNPGEQDRDSHLPTGQAESEAHIDTLADDSNIEQTLNSLDNQDQQVDLPDELDTYLVRKDEGQRGDRKDGKLKYQEDSEGNDTDDLLRMLEDDGKGKKMKKSQPVVTLNKKPQAASSDEDDDFVFESASLEKLKVNNSIIRKFSVTKAVPEQTTSDEESSDDEVTVQKMFAPKKPGNYAAKSTAKQSAITKPTSNLANNVLKVTGNSVLKTVDDKRQPAIRTYVNKNAQNRGLKLVAAPAQPARFISNSTKAKGKAVSTEMKRSKISQTELEEIINEEEFLEDDDIDLDENFAAESDSDLEKRMIRQRIMRPEQMDEDMLSDGDSQSEDGSFCDELPSSGSEDELDDWFTIDVRAERAGEYLPLLGARAFELLSQEKRRVSSRVAALRQSIASLGASGKRQAERLRRATAGLADVDDLLRAS